MYRLPGSRNSRRALPAPMQTKTSETAVKFEWLGNHIRVLDQRQVPQYEIYLTFTRTQEIAQAIKSGIILDEVAIRKACASSIYLAALRKRHTTDWKQALKADFEVLRKAVVERQDCWPVLDQMQSWVLNTVATPEASHQLCYQLGEFVESMVNSDHSVD